MPAERRGMAAGIVNVLGSFNQFVLAVGAALIRLPTREAVVARPRPA